MADYPFSILDVFAEQAYAGNQLAVVENAAALTDAQMQAIALEMNFSETTFVLAYAGDRARVRIFTPTFELPFAGHPTIGTAWALTQGQRPITLELQAGDVEVVFEHGVAWMTPPPVQLGQEFEREVAAQLIGLSLDQLDANLPVRLAEVGPQFVLIPVADLACLKAAALNQQLHRTLLEQGVAVQCVFLFTAEAYGDDADFASRMFFASAGVREDPATGSANSAFAAYLLDMRGPLGTVVVDQGVEIHRPSRIYLRVQEVLQVGGKVYRVVQGTLSI